MRAPGHHPGHPWHPGYMPRHPGYRYHSARRGRLVDDLWGSLLAAPVDRLGQYVTWPGTTHPITPLIGTPSTAPCVTPHPCLTANGVINTLLWSTFRRSRHPELIRPDSKPLIGP